MGGRRRQRLRRPRPLLDGIARGQLRRELRLLLREPTITRWVHLCEAEVTASHALWEAVRAVDPTFPEHSPLGDADSGEPWDRMPDAFTLARAFHWARRQRQIEATERKKQRSPR